jgi:hypothetical protein
MPLRPLVSLYCVVMHSTVQDNSGAFYLHMSNKP